MVKDMCSQYIRNKVVGCGIWKLERRCRPPLTEEGISDSRQEVVSEKESSQLGSTGGRDGMRQTAENG